MTSNLASMPHHDFVEQLVWEDGDILMRGPSSRTQKSSSCINIFSPHTFKAQDKIGGNTITTKRARFGTLGSIFGDSPLLVPSGHKEFGMDPYLMNYVTHNDPQHNAATTVSKDNSNDKQHLTDSHVVSLHDSTNSKPGNASRFVGEDPQLNGPRSGQCQASTSFIRSRVSDFISNNIDSSHQVIVSENLSHNVVGMGGLPNLKMQEEQDPGPDKKKGLVNFSHFLRPAALVKANIQSTAGVVTRPATGQGSSTVEKLKSNDRMSAAGSSNPIKDSGTAKLPKEPLLDKLYEAVQKDACRNYRLLDQVPGQTSSFAASTAKGKPDTVKSIEPLVTSSSVCSRRASNGPKYTLKRKYQDTHEESAYLSENVIEVEGVTKAVPARGSAGAKRSRTADVHNLSERRKRGKIDKKMRTLQELIPNCSKVDKASMLDEAIEYLKTLQLQVQIMSIGTRLCMPPMMLPAGMQQIHAPHLTHFSPVGVGMGMRMGMGVGCSPVHFPNSPISAATTLPGITGTGFQMLGIPGQVFPMSVSHSPFIPSPAGPLTQSVLVPGVARGATPVEHPGSAPPSSLNDSIQKTNSETHNGNVKCSKNQTLNGNKRR